MIKRCFLFPTLLFLLIVIYSVSAQATFYDFTIEAKGPADPAFNGSVLDGAGKIAEQGIDDLLTMSWTVRIDLDAEGFDTQYNGNVWIRDDIMPTHDYFYADYISGPWLEGGPVWTGTTNYQEYNKGLQRAEDTVDHGYFVSGKPK
jgi:hypothetical protein